MASSPPDRKRLRSDLGFVALEWLLAVLLLLLPAVSLGAGVSRWPEHQQIARAAAAEAARAAVLATTYDEAIETAAATAQLVAHNYGVPDTAITVEVDLPAWTWGATVTVTVTVVMPTLEIPGIGTWRATSWSTSATGRIDDYRALRS